MVDIDPEDLPADVHRYLIPAERVVLMHREHWLSLWQPASYLAIGVLVTGLARTALPDQHGVQNVCVALMLVAALWFVWRWLNWRRDWFVATDRRLLKTYGILTRQVSMMPLSKVTDMRYERTPLGKLVGYGTFVLESAGQEQALSTINWVHEPDETYRTVTAQIFKTPARRQDDSRSRRARRPGREPAPEAMFRGGLEPAPEPDPGREPDREQGHDTVWWR